jgi:hypothetical protein
MPVSELDIWRSANELSKAYGEEAWDRAVERYFEMKEKGNKAGVKVWRQIAQLLSPPDVSPN